MTGGYVVLYGVSSHPLRWSGMPVPTYLLLESQGNWQASRDAGVQAAAHVEQRFARQFESVQSSEAVQALQRHGPSSCISF